MMVHSDGHSKSVNPNLKAVVRMDGDSAPPNRRRRQGFGPQEQNDKPQRVSLGVLQEPHANTSICGAVALSFAFWRGTHSNNSATATRKPGKCGSPESSCR